MPGPGAYLPDPSEKLTRPDDMPKAMVKQRSRIYKKSPCPHCNRPARRHVIAQRKLRHLGDLASGRPIELLLRYTRVPFKTSLV